MKEAVPVVDQWQLYSVLAAVQARYADLVTQLTSLQLKAGLFDDAFDAGVESVLRNGGADNVEAYVCMCSFAMPQVRARIAVTNLNPIVAEVWDCFDAAAHDAVPRHSRVLHGGRPPRTKQHRRHGDGRP